MKLFWTPEAISDRLAIYDYIEVDDPRAALSLDALISDKARMLESFPKMARPGRVAGTRELVVHPNYIVVYDLYGTQIRVLRILHAARPWPPAEG